MIAKIDQDGCISCGMCASICPAVFRMSDAGPAEVYVDSVEAGFVDDVTEAKDACPVSVITVE